MTFLDAIKTGLPMRLPDKTFTTRGFLSNSVIMPNTWIDPLYLLEHVSLKIDHILSEDWEVKNDFEMEYV